MLRIPPLLFAVLLGSGCLSDGNPREHEAEDSQEGPLEFDLADFGSGGWVWVTGPADPRVQVTWSADFVFERGLQERLGACRIAAISTGDERANITLPHVRFSEVGSGGGGPADPSTRVNDLEVGAGVGDETVVQQHFSARAGGIFDGGLVLGVGSDVTPSSALFAFGPGDMWHDSALAVNVTGITASSLEKGGMECDLELADFGSEFYLVSPAGTSLAGMKSYEVSNGAVFLVEARADVSYDVAIISPEGSTIATATYDARSGYGLQTTQLIVCSEDPGIYELRVNDFSASAAALAKIGVAVLDAGPLVAQIFCATDTA